MRIAFIDPADSFDYNPSTPLQKPLGGTQSAVSYLTAGLARLGHGVALVNRLSRTGIYEGVDCPGWAVGFTPGYLESFDALVGINAMMGADLRAMGIRAPLVFWAHHAADEPAVAKLSDKNERAAWDRVALVSDWQKGEYLKSFAIDPERAVVLRNAISPAVEAARRDLAPFYRRAAPPTLIYTSTPFRGLDVLLLAFPAIRRQIAGCRLEVYSGMGIYGVPSERDGYRVLYDVCRALEGVEYKGVVGQTALAAALARADILAYPNTFPETACIGVMEAMAAGCLILTSKLAALPETTAGFGFLLPTHARPAVHASDFARMVGDVCRNALENPGNFDRLIEAQSHYARTEYSWAARAKEWERVLSALSRTG